LGAGAHFGRLLIRRAESGEEVVRIPYWYGVPRPEAANITFLPYPPAEAEAGSSVDLWFLTTDAIGAAAVGEEPQVVVEEGGGAVVEVQRRPQLAPGLVRVTVRLGPGQDVDNVFRIRCGAAEARAYITGY
jgi:hypothetical protein